MEEKQGNKCEKGNEDEFHEKAKEDLEPLFAVRVDDEEGDIDGLNHTPCTVDGHHEQAVWVHHG